MAGLCDSHVGLLLMVCRCLPLPRFTSALTPFDLVTACISTELLPARPAASIKKRFANLICKCCPMLLPGASNLPPVNTQSAPAPPAGTCHPASCAGGLGPVLLMPLV